MTNFNAEYSDKSTVTIDAPDMLTAWSMAQEDVEDKTVVSVYLTPAVVINDGPIVTAPDGTKWQLTVTSTGGTKWKRPVTP